MILAEGSLHMHSTPTDLQFDSIYKGLRAFLKKSEFHRLLQLVGAHLSQIWRCQGFKGKKSILYCLAYCY
jgi:hypothetical protein